MSFPCTYSNDNATCWDRSLSNTNKYHLFRPCKIAPFIWDRIQSDSVLHLKVTFPRWYSCYNLLFYCSVYYNVEMYLYLLIIYRYYLFKNEEVFGIITNMLPLVEGAYGRLPHSFSGDILFSFNSGEIFFPCDNLPYTQLKAVCL